VGKAMTFVVLVWLSVVLVFSAWMIAQQSGRYVRFGNTPYEYLLDTYTGTTYKYRGHSRGYVVQRCGPSAYLCERPMGA